MAQNAPRRGSAAWLYSSEPRAGSWRNIRRASQGFPPPYTPEFNRRQSATRKVSMAGEKIPEEESGMHEGKIPVDVHSKTMATSSARKSCIAAFSVHLLTVWLLGEEKFHQLGWKRLTICLIVEAIALGSLSIPSAFAALGMVAGVLLSVGLGLVAIYTSYVVGQVKMRHPHVSHYADAVKLIWGKFGYELAGAMFAIFLILITGSHVLTGTIAWNRIVGEPSICALVWGVISMIILFVVALPPTFAEFGKKHLIINLSHAMACLPRPMRP